MHDLKTISLAQRSFSPELANCNLAVEFDCDAIALKLQMFDELRQGSAIGAFSWVAIDDHSHDSSVVEEKRPPTVGGLRNVGLERELDLQINSAIRSLCAKWSTGHRD